MRVFLSWRGCDKAVKDDIVAEIRAVISEEDEVWESDGNVISDALPECMEALETSSVFVLILSDASMESSYVITEIKKAIELEMEGKLDILLYRLTDTPLNNRVFPFIGHITDANCIARGEGTELGKKELAKRVRTLLEKRKSGNC